MPWCGYWGTAVTPFSWILPLIGFAFMIVMFFVCLRVFGFGCMGGRRRTSGGVSDVQREVESLKDDVRKSKHHPI